MISKTDLQKIYQWGLKTKFPLKLAPTTKGYTNKDIFICGLKFVRKNVNIKKNLMTKEIYDIIKDDDILYAVYSIFAGGTILRPHKDPDVYSARYKRIQIPLKVPKGCFMLWGKEKIIWKEGEPQCYPVMDKVHQASNPSDKPIEFLFLDVKMDTVVEL